MTTGSTEQHKTWLVTSLVVLLGVIFFAGLRFAPPGLAGKLWAIGYSVCNQIASHSYRMDGTQLQFYARCTGLFLGALCTLTILGVRSRKGTFPKVKYRWALMAIILLAYAIDGVNSALYEIAPSLSLYTPSNLLRLITGVLMGTTLGVLLVGIWNQILRKDTPVVHVLNPIREGGLLLATGGVIVLIVNPGWNFVYYPVALLSTAGVVVLISAVYTLLWTLGLKKENTLTRWTDRSWIFLLATTAAVTQIALMDGLRLLLTYRWAGIPL